MDDRFGQALDAGDYVTASSVLSEVRNNGFEKDALVMKEVLLDVPVVHLLNSISPYA